MTQYFPGIVDHISVAKLGKKKDYFGGLSSNEYWRNKTVNDLFEIDDYSALNPISNAYFIGSWVKPEAGISGMIQTGVEYGDIIDDLIYHGNDDEYFITHDELIRHCETLMEKMYTDAEKPISDKPLKWFVGFKTKSAGSIGAGGRPIPMRRRK